MKRIIMLLSLSLALFVTTSDGQVMAKAKTHKKHKAHVVSAIHPNIVKPTPRPADQASLLKMADANSCDDQCVVGALGMAEDTASQPEAYLCPSLNTAMCDVNTRFGMLSNSIIVNPLAATLIDVNATPSVALMVDTSAQEVSINNYYYAKAVYAPPTSVTVGGFSTPVNDNPLYYSLFKHRHGSALPLHNSKGVDETAAYGVSPRANSHPESIGPSPFATDASGVKATPNATVTASTNPER